MPRFSRAGEGLPVYEKILVTLDASPVDEAIVSHVERLAGVHQSTVYLMRVAHYHTRGERSHEVEQALEYLDQIRGRLEARGLRVETVLAHGEPSEQIIRQAEEIGCDLIAMSTHGHGLVGDLIFGSVARDVRHGTEIPVLFIRTTTT